MSTLLRRLSTTITPDRSRVLGRLFVPGHEHFTTSESRATGVLGSLLALPEEDVVAALEDVRARYADRHGDLPQLLRRNFDQIEHRIPPGPPLSVERQLLLGACFTQEYSLEAAALFNPSAVAHPDQSGLADGELRFLLSLRAVGEGHLSSIVFHSGVLGPSGEVQLESRSPHTETGSVRSTTHSRTMLAARLAEEGADEESTRFLLALLPTTFGTAELADALSDLAGQSVTRHGAAHTAGLALTEVGCEYEVVFDPTTKLTERVLWPVTPSESHGMEDARFVQLADGRYVATYTAYDGRAIRSRLLETRDFEKFRVGQLAGDPASHKGMALFPRTVGGQHLALSRHDRESCSLAVSEDGLVWRAGAPVHAPTRPWELIQTGNCGSPVETDRGWLVLTHGVGPMREYVIGALLLDLDDPSVVLGSLREPLLRASATERDGYVPNVVYTCGGLRHGDLLLLPYGTSDTSVAFSVVDLPALVTQLLRDGPSPTTRVNSSA